MVLLRTERLCLRPLALDDTDALQAHWTDPGVRRYLWDDDVIDRATAEQTVQTSLQHWEAYGIGLFVVTTSDDAGIIGCCGAWRFGEPNDWEILYSLSPDYWGRGLAVEASRAALRLAFETLRVERIGGRTDPPNAASIRVLEKLGFRSAGTKVVNGRDTLCYWLYRDQL